MVFPTVVIALRLGFACATCRARGPSYLPGQREDLDGRPDHARGAAQIEHDVPVSSVRDAQPHRRFDCFATVVVELGTGPIALLAESISNTFARAARVTTAIAPAF